ncbi:MAG TPA: hypothetical protein PK743_03825 [Luteimonas sp.]|nr:hypothetical protein [Luteimonas sp.]
MRPADDLAIRARNWFWYWRVRNISGLSNDQLDRKCFGDVARKRHFERLQQTAASPDEFALINGQTLLEIVDHWDAPDGEDGPYASATKAFQSQAWTYLSTRDLAPNVYSDFVQKYVQEKGWIRARANELPLYITFLGQSEPAIQPGVSTAYSAMLHKLVNEATPEEFAVLIALFREAIHGVLLEQAIAIKSALTSCLSLMCRRYSMPDEFMRLLWILVDDRVFSNRWLTEADWRQHAGTHRKNKLSSRERMKEFRAWVNWYVNSARAIHQAGYGSFPIVPTSPRIDWLLSNRDLLMTAQKEILRLRNEHWMLEDSSSALSRSYAEDAQIEANRILKQHTPPDVESARFYVSCPPVEMGNLPRPY